MWISEVEKSEGGLRYQSALGTYLIFLLQTLTSRLIFTLKLLMCIHPQLIHSTF